MSEQAYFSFTEQDLAVFSEASGDRNPLHLNQEYARRTPYGQPVVFGCLGALAGLGQIRLPVGWRATSLEAEFLRPMFVGVKYRIETSEKNGKWEARLFDGSTPAVLVTVIGKVFSGNQAREEVAAASAFERGEAAARRQEDIVAGLKASGVYAWSAAAVDALSARWGVGDRLLATALCFGSYLVGMELPGESALFFRLALRFEGTVRFPATMDYRASIAYSGFGQVKLDVSLFTGASTIASGQCWSYVRPPVPEVEEIVSDGLRPDSLAGRAAVLIGSSRGLGAAMKRALELRGAAVYGLSRSASLEQLSQTEVGDAADSEALRRLRKRVSRAHSCLDFLICNACPPLLPLLLETNAVERIAAYFDSAVSMTLAPLSEFLELLNSSDGCAVIISSAAVEHPVKEWPHYVAAKRAVEALGCVASLQYPRVRTLIVRPQKLHTTLTNTPMGMLGAASPGLLANRIAARLEVPLEPGTAEILH